MTKNNAKPFPFDNCYLEFSPSLAKSGEYLTTALEAVKQIRKYHCW